MLKFTIKELTLNEFERLQETGYGDLLEPARFVATFKDPIFVANVVYKMALFEERPRPTKEDFFASIKGTDFKALREAWFNAYRDFFPARAQICLERWLDGARETAAAGWEESLSPIA